MRYDGAAENGMRMAFLTKLITPAPRRINTTFIQEEEKYARNFVFFLFYISLSGSTFLEKKTKLAEETTPNRNISFLWKTAFFPP